MLQQCPTGTDIHTHSVPLLYQVACGLAPAHMLDPTHHGLPHSPCSRQWHFSVASPSKQAHPLWRVLQLFSPLRMLFSLLFVGPPASFSSFRSQLKYHHLWEAFSDPLLLQCPFYNLNLFIVLTIVWDDCPYLFYCLSSPQNVTSKRAEVLSGTIAKKQPGKE